MSWTPTKEQRKYLEIVVSMSTDCILGCGVDSLRTYLVNLEIVIDSMSSDIVGDEASQRFKAAQDFMDSLRGNDQ